MTAERTFGDWLRQRRQALDLTRQELARQVGCSPATLRKLEAEERRPSKQMAERLADVLQVLPDERPTFVRFARGDPFAAQFGQELTWPAPPNGRTAPPSNLLGGTLPLTNTAPAGTIGRPLRPVEAAHHNLPHQLTSFIGRERDIAEVNRLLTTARLVTLLGAGGSGKTRLALQCAAGLLDQFPEGVWLVELAPLADPALAPQAVATVLGLMETPGRTITDRLLDHLRPKRLLLVLDNCEHLIGACASLVETLLHAAPDLRILVTSRESLNVAGENTYPVRPLEAPGPQAELSVDSLKQFEAVRLFVDRAQAVSPDFTLASSNVLAVAQVCWRLDGIPLAIELAAARVRLLTAEQIAARLGDAFRLLTGGSRTALPRQQTLRATMDWSYDLLAEAERVVLQRVSVFAGGWTLEAAEAVGAGAGVAPGDVLDLLTRLANKSLVVIDREPENTARYRLLETVRQYALTKLLASGETNAAWERLAEYYLELAKTRRSAEWLTSDGDYNRRLIPELDNLRGALGWSRSAASSAEMALRLASSAMVVWIDQGHWNEARDFLEGALGAAGAEAPSLSSLRARAVYGLGALVGYQGDFALARTHLFECLRLAGGLNNRLMIAWIMTRLGELSLEQGDAADARRRYEESLLLFRELGNPDGVAWVSVNLGEVALQEEDAAQASTYIEEGLALFRAAKQPQYVGWALHDLSLAAQLRGDFERARRLGEDSLAQFREYAETYLGAPWAFLSLGQTALAQGKGLLAKAHLVEALALFRREGDRGGMAYCLAGLAGVAGLGGDPERAARLWGAAETLRQAIGARPAPAARATRERLMAAAREQLGETKFEAAWAEGQALTVEQAMALALEATE